ncbi:MAG: hypothetical protein GY841_00745 [FCB group bacterium]|nr:hypothetical protein [FCB group bacterium]
MKQTIVLTSLFIVATLLVVLKLTSVINWSWVIVLIPTYFIVALILILALVAYSLVKNVDEELKEMNEIRRKKD